MGGSWVGRVGSVKLIRRVMTYHLFT